MLYFEPLFSIYIHGIVSVLLTALMLLIVYIFSNKKPNVEKNSAYECGFKPFDYGYFPFDVHFYRVGILFLLFDVEILFFFPWLLNFYEVSSMGHAAVIVFIAILFFGFIYELQSGALHWSPVPWAKAFLFRKEPNVY
jgi:NADH-quinone oxidoreductase subunit A